ncbi:MAG: serine protease [Clostridia bacterium]|nr:serine protease [Clostridia bacterium]
MKTTLKKLKSWFLVFLLLPCLLIFSACGKNGLSAYEIAKKNGFVGTEQEWLDSLKGDDGENGLNATAPSYYDIYTDAKENNEFAGTYLEFLKEVFGSENADNSATINKSLSSVVAIKAYNTPTSPKNGSGVIYSISSSEIIIITNYHVVYSANTLPNNVFETIKVTLFGELSNYSTEATFVGGSRTYDIAVLKVTDTEAFKNANATAARVNTAAPKIGISVFAIGNSKGFGISTTTGIISRNNDLVKMNIANEDSKYRLLRHSAMITGGNSGGGLFNAQGELIGITNGGDNTDKFINYAIPASAVYAVTNNILSCCDGETVIKPQELKHGLVFSSTESTLEFDHLNGETIITDEVFVSFNGTELPEFSAISTGDIITKIKIQKTSISADNPEVLTKDITRLFEINEFVLLASAGDKITFYLNNNGTDYEATATLSAEDFESIN